MIKTFIKKSMLLFTLIVLVVYTVQAILQGKWGDTLFLWQLVFVSGLISLAQLLLSKFKSNYYLLEVIIEYVMVCIIVSMAGLALGWFKLYYLWQIFLYITPVYIIGYFLDLCRAKRDVDYINEKIKQRMERGKRFEPGDNKDEEC